jgi:hypothetical protein
VHTVHPKKGGGGDSVINETQRSLMPKNWRVKMYAYDVVATIFYDTVQLVH